MRPKKLGLFSLYFFIGKLKQMLLINGLIFYTNNIKKIISMYLLVFIKYS